MRRKFKDMKVNKKKYIPKVGDAVEYVFDEEGWFRGKIVSIQKRSRTVAIQFADGDYSTDLSMRDVRPFESYKQGERIVANGVECTFEGIKATGDAIVRLDTGGIRITNMDRISRP